jgi:TetR/AcrR family transcriptional regulator
MNAPVIDRNTEELILDAARRVFTEKGMDGARMQEIADIAGINKALLHYYFRTKEKLFNTIFNQSFGEFFSRMSVLIVEETDLLVKISSFIDTYMDVMLKNPFLPKFVITEINRNPQVVVDKFNAIGAEIIKKNLRLLEKQIKEESQKGNIKYIDPKQLVSSIIALCLFPFLAEPLLRMLLFEGDSVKYEKYLKDRKKVVEQIILDALKP